MKVGISPRFHAIGLLRLHGQADYGFVFGSLCAATGRHAPIARMTNRTMRLMKRSPNPRNNFTHPAYNDPYGLYRCRIAVSHRAHSVFA